MRRFTRRARSRGSEVSISPQWTMISVFRWYLIDASHVLADFAGIAESRCYNLKESRQTVAIRLHLSLSPRLYISISVAYVRFSGFLLIDFIDESRDPKLQNDSYLLQRRSSPSHRASFPTVLDPYASIYHFISRSLTIVLICCTALISLDRNTVEFSFDSGPTSTT